MDRRKFLTYVGCSCCGFVINACSTAPITERKQLKLIPEAKLNAQAAQIYEKVKEKEKLIKDSKSLTEIKEIGAKMEDAISIYFEKSNLPNRVLCKDETGEIDCVFFNSYEGYIKKILPIGKEVTISGKIKYFRNKYQLTNPKYVSEDSSIIKQKHSSYSLTDGISEKVYNKIILQIINNLPQISEWHSKDILRKFDNISWNDSIKKLHKPENIGKFNDNFYQRLAFDEIFSTFLVNSEIRKKIKKIKKTKKKFNIKKQNEIISKLNFSLTNDQNKTLNEINKDLSSENKMFRLLQGDVGCGKTIVSLLSAYNTIISGFQVAVMTPTEILARQHFLLAKKIFPKNIDIDLLSGKSPYKDKKNILKGISNKKIDIVFWNSRAFSKQS